jgi:Domain of unknown function (DUF4326)
MPERLRRHRTKGWRKPGGAVIVDRTSHFGNPFRVGIHGDRETCVRRYRQLLSGLIDMVTQPCPDYASQAAALDHVRANLDRLRGRDLICPCDFDGPCHADVLLELANGGTNEEASCPRPL